MAELRRYFLVLGFVAAASCITCYSGFKFLNGMTVGDATINCNTGAQCYNMSAKAGQYLDVVKAGCSLWRCLFASNRCISTSFQNVPISLCCCSQERCNVNTAAIDAGNDRQQQITGSNTENVEELKRLRAQFAEASLDDERHNFTAPTAEPNATEVEVS